MTQKNIFEKEGSQYFDLLERAKRISLLEHGIWETKDQIWIFVNGGEKYSVGLILPKHYERTEGSLDREERYIIGQTQTGKECIFACPGGHPHIKKTLQDFLGEYVDGDLTRGGCMRVAKAMPEAIIEVDVSSQSDSYGMAHNGYVVDRMNEIFQDHVLPIKVGLADGSDFTRAPIQVPEHLVFKNAKMEFEEFYCQKGVQIDCPPWCIKR